MSEHTVVDLLPNDPIPSTDVSTFEDSFEGNSDGNRFRADGITWDEATGRSEDGRTLTRVPSRRSVAFTWYDDRGTDRFCGV